MNDTTSPRQPLGAPVGGTAPVSPANAPSAALARILARIDDQELREQLMTPRGGQFCRAVAAELDLVMQAVERTTDTAGSERGPLISNVEAEAIIRFLDQHFVISGSTPNPGQRLTMRIMMTLKGLVDQITTLQETVSKARGGGTPVG